MLRSDNTTYALNGCVKLLRASLHVRYVIVLREQRDSVQPMSTNIAAGERMPGHFRHD